MASSYTFRNVARMEWIKLRTLRSVRWTLLLALAGMIGIGIAAALLGDPPVLIFDEPVNGLDPEGIRWIRNLMKSLAAEGRTVFVSSHLIAEMALTAERLIVIGAGRLLADTTVAELSATNTSLEDAFLALTSGSAEFRAAESN